MKVQDHGGRWLAAALTVSMAVAVASCQGRTDTSIGAGASIAVEPGAQTIPHDAIEPMVQRTPEGAIKARPQGIPHDWSHRHLIFSRPSSQAMALRMEREPRYRIQQAWRQLGAGSSEAWMRALDALAVQLASAPSRKDGPIASWGRPLLGHPTRVVNGAWSEDLGSSAKVGAGMYPAKYSFDPIGAPSCTNDFVVFSTGVTGTGSQASIVAYNNLYAGSTGSGGCGTSGVPTVDWAYNTGGKIVTSVVLSADGSQIAFIHTGSSSASLVVLKWAASSTESVSSPLTLSAVSSSSYRTCTAPCMSILGFANLNNDVISAPFYDYTNDVLYVGDNNGYVHQFTGIFKGTPAETTNSIWPVQARTGFILTSPVLDSGVSPAVVYVADSAGDLDYFPVNTGSLVKSGTIGPISPNITDGPVVDSVAGKIYVSVPGDGSGNSGVFLFSRGFGSGTKGTEAKVGAAASTNPISLYDGDFDNTYYNSSNATGNFYVCGDAGGNPTLYQVQINAGAFPSNNVHTGPSLASANVTCSPVTEIYNPTATGGPFDWIFLSVQGSGSMSPCGGGGCVMNFTVTAWQASTAYSVSQEILDSNLNIEKVTTAGTSGSSQPASWNVTTGGTTGDGTNGLVWTNQGSMGTNAASRAETGGTSGIIVDNTSTSTGASQIYFSTLSSGTCTTSGGSGGCAVQASQSGLN